MIPMPMMLFCHVHYHKRICSAGDAVWIPGVKVSGKIHFKWGWNGKKDRNKTEIKTCKKSYITQWQIQGGALGAGSPLLVLDVVIIWSQVS